MEEAKCQYIDSGFLIFFTICITYCCWIQKGSAVALFLKHDATVEVKSKTGLTPVHIASSQTNLKIVKLLLRFNTDIKGATLS